MNQKIILPFLIVDIVVFVTIMYIMFEVF